MGKVVKAPLVIAKRADGSDVYVYAGAPLPDDLASGEAERLADFLEDDAAPVEAPKGNASLDEWQAYAQARGASAEDIDGLSRDELRERFGS